MLEEGLCSSVTIGFRASLSAPHLKQDIYLYGGTIKPWAEGELQSAWVYLFIFKTERLGYMKLFW